MSDQDMEELLDLVEKHLGKQWIEITDWLREHNQLEDIEERLRAHDYEAAIKGVEDAALRFAAETHAAFVLSAQRNTEWLDGKVDSLVRFDVQNEHAVAAAKTNQFEWVTGWTQEVRETVQQILVRGREKGTNPLDLARDIRDSIGLTPQQEAAVASYREALEQQDWSNALGRELSNGHSDRTIAAARDAGRALTKAQIDTAVARYRDNMQTSRAETISRTESLRAIHEGQQEGFRQAIARGDVDADELIHEWHHALVGRFSRPDHVKMDGVQVQFGQDFELPDGVRMKFPGDPRGGAKHNANCRCTRSTTLADIRKRVRKLADVVPLRPLAEHLADVRADLELPLAA